MVFRHGITEPKKINLKQAKRDRTSPRPIRASAGDIEGRSGWRRTAAVAKLLNDSPRGGSSYDARRIERPFFFMLPQDVIQNILVARL